MITKILFLALLIFLSLSANSQDIEDQKTAKKLEKTTKRFIHPQSKYISFSGGWFFSYTHINDPNQFFDPFTSLNTGIIPSLIYELGIANNFFAEIGYDRTLQGMGISRDMGDDQAWSIFASPLLLNHRRPKLRSNNLHLGAGYRLTGKNNYHFLNFHAGIFFGFSNKSHAEMKPHIGKENEYIRNEVHLNHSYYFIRTIDTYSRYNLGPYVAVSKEFRMSDDVRFFVKYTHRFGLIPVFTGTVTLHSTQIDFENPVSFKVNGGGSFINGGLKVALFKNRLTN